MDPLAPVRQLRERDPDLRRPAERVEAGRDVPHGVPGEVLVAVIVDLRVELHPGRIDAELEAGAAVVMGVEEQPDLVGGGEVIAAGEDGDDAVRVGVERPDEDVEVARVIRDFRFGRQLRRAALAGPPLLELGDRLRQPPDGVIVAPVDYGRLSGAGCGDTPGSRWRRVRGARSVGRLRGKRDGCDERQRKQHEVSPGWFPRLMTEPRKWLFQVLTRRERRARGGGGGATGPPSALGAVPSGSRASPPPPAARARPPPAPAHPPAPPPT